MHEGHRERMRKKMIERSDFLEPHEVLETLLFYSVPRKNVNETAHKLLDKFGGSVKGVLGAEPNSLLSVEGVGESTVCLLKTVEKLISYVNSEKEEKHFINNFFDAQNKMSSYFTGLNTEKAVMLFLAKNGSVLGKVEFMGEGEEVSIDLVKVNELLLSLKPRSVIFAHNHVSGNPSPSPQDYDTTKRLMALFKLNDVSLYDHIIFAQEKFYSFFGSGELQKMKNSLDYLL